MQEADQHTQGLNLCEAWQVCSVFGRVLEHPEEAVSVLGLPWDPGWKTKLTPHQLALNGCCCAYGMGAKKAPSMQKRTQRVCDPMSNKGKRNPSVGFSAGSVCHGLEGQAATESVASHVHTSGSCSCSQHQCERARELSCFGNTLHFV